MNFAEFMADLTERAKPKVAIQFHSRRSNSADLRLRSQISQLRAWGLDLPAFVRDLQQWMKTTSVGNHACFAIHYTIKYDIDKKRAEVWHEKVTTGKLDWKVATITEEGGEP